MEINDMQILNVYKSFQGTIVLTFLGEFEAEAWLEENKHNWPNARLCCYGMYYNAVELEPLNEGN